jgi:hypothetical protein
MSFSCKVRHFLHQPARSLFDADPHLANDDGANFNIIARKLINEARPVFVVFPRSDGAGGFDFVPVIPH